MLISLIILGLLWYLIGFLPLPAPIKGIIDVVFVIIAILIVLGAVGFFGTAYSAPVYFR